MKTNRLFVAIATVSFLSILSACDPIVDYEKAIFNSTDSELLLVRNNPIPFDDQDVSYSQSILLDSAIIPVNGRQLLNGGFDIGGSVEAFTDCPGLEEGDSIFVWVRDGASQRLALTITKDNFVGTHREISNDQCECVFEITDSLLD